MGQDLVERSGDTLEIEGIHEKARISGLAARAGGDEAPKLLVGGSAAPRRHLLELAESLQVTVRADDFFGCGDAERADELVLQVRDADVEPELLHLLTTEVGSQTDTLERAAKDGLLAGIAEAREPQAVARRAELFYEPPDAVRPCERHDPDPRRCEVDPPPRSQGLDRDLVARALDDEERAGIIAIGT